MSARLPDEVKALFDAPNFRHLATVNPDGSPHCTVMSYLVGLRRVWYRPPARR